MGQSIDVDYVVEREDDRWTVNFQGQHCGHFPSCKAALHSAVGDAVRVRRLGHRVRVLVRRVDGSLRSIRWRPLQGDVGQRFYAQAFLTTVRATPTRSQRAAPV